MKIGNCPHCRREVVLVKAKGKQITLDPRIPVFAAWDSIAQDGGGGTRAFQVHEGYFAAHLPICTAYNKRAAMRSTDTGALDDVVEPRGGTQYR